MSLFQPLRLTRRRLQFLAGTILALLALEGAARWLEPAFPNRIVFYDAGAQLRIEQLDRLEDRHVDVLFAGSSVVKHGLVPTEFTDADPHERRALNVGISGAGPDVTARFLGEEVLSRVDPELVVYGIASQDMHLTSRRLEVIERYQSAPATDPSILGRLRRTTVERLAAYRIRSHLRAPDRLWHGIRRRINDDPAPPQEQLADESRYLKPDGYSRRFVGRAYSDRVADGLRRDLDDYRVDPERLRILEDLVDDLRRRDIRVVLFLTPVTEDYAEYHTGGAGFAGFRDTMKTAAADMGVPLVDLSTSLQGHRHFADPYHLNNRGARRTTTLLAQELTPALRGPQSGTPLPEEAT